MQARMRGVSNKPELDEVQEDILASLIDDGPIEGELNAAEVLAKRMGAPVSRLPAKIRQLEHAGYLVTIYNGGHLVSSVYVTADGCRAAGVSAKKANVPANFDELKDGLAALKPPPKKRSGTSVATSLRLGTLGRESSGRNKKPPNKRSAKKPTPAPAPAPSEVKAPSKRMVQFDHTDLTEMDLRILRELATGGEVESSNAILTFIGRADDIAYAESRQVSARLRFLAEIDYVFRLVQKGRVRRLDITTAGQQAYEVAAS